MIRRYDASNPADLVILGGGPAGMSAALTAGRARLKAVVVNAESPRNSVTTASHGFLTRDGAHPTELLAIGKEQLATYRSVTYIKGQATAVERMADGFAVTLADGSQIETHRLIIATGHVDDLDQLSIPGIADVYGTTVYPCIFCDGFEHQDERIALFGAEAAMYAPTISLWTNDLVVFTNGTTPSAKAIAEFRANKIELHTESIQSLESVDGRLVGVRLETGDRIERDAGFISDEYSRPATHFAEQLGVESVPNDWGGESLDANEAGATNVAGLYVIGDAQTGFSGIVAAAAQGALCVEMMVHAIAADRWLSV